MKHIVLLQSTIYFQSETSWRSVAIMGGITIALVIVLTVINRIVTWRNRNRYGKKYKRRAFRREAVSKGLSMDQIRLLETCISLFNIKHPFNLLIPSPLLVNTIGKALIKFSSMQQNESTIEKQKLDLYRIIHKIELYANKKKLKKPSIQIKIGEYITIISRTKKEQEFGMEMPVSLNTKEFLGIDLDQSVDRKFIGKNTRVTIHIHEDNKKFILASRTLGIIKIDDRDVLMLQHGTGVLANEQRIHTRSKLRCQCTFYQVKVIESGRKRKIVRQAVVDTKNKMTGHTIEISPGGCTIESRHRVITGTLIKMEINLLRSDERVEVFGKVKNFRSNARRRFIKNIMFTKITAKNLNKINALFYGIG